MDRVQRNQGIKTIWRNLSITARLGTAFGWLDCMRLCYGRHLISRDTAMQLVKENISLDQIKEYRRVKQIPEQESLLP